jgi:hypothetical protein
LISSIFLSPSSVLTIVPSLKHLGPKHIDCGKELETEKALPLWVPEKIASTLELDNVTLIPFLLY